MKLRKGDVHVLRVSRLGKRGEGVGELFGIPVYVDNALVGEEVRVKVVLLRKQHAFGKVLEHLTLSEDRVEPRCLVAKRCGGCQMQHLDYSQQLTYKSSAVVAELGRYDWFDEDSCRPIVGMADPWQFRNKLQLAFEHTRPEEGLKIGLYASRSHDVVDMTACWVVPDEMNRAIQAVRDWYRSSIADVFDEKTGKGCLRFLTLRYAEKTQSLMLVLTVAQEFSELPSFIQVLSAIPEIRSIYLTQQGDPKNDEVCGSELSCVWGAATLKDCVAGIDCEVSPRSFLQANSKGVATLYEHVQAGLGWQGQGSLLDLYCGTGIMTLMLAKAGGKVIGVDSNHAAIADAQKNADRNHLDVQFICESASVFVKENPGLLDSKSLFLVVDPPRKGCEIEVLDAIIRCKPQRFCYVSCNPVTLGRDLDYLKKAGLCIDMIQPIDMFCHTTHVEVVVSGGFLGV